MMTSKKPRVYVAVHNDDYSGELNVVAVASKPDFLEKKIKHYAMDFVIDAYEGDDPLNPKRLYWDFNYKGSNDPNFYQIDVSVGVPNKYQDTNYVSILTLEVWEEEVVMSYES